MDKSTEKSLLELASLVAKRVQIEGVYIQNSSYGRHPDLEVIPDEVEIKFGIAAKGSLSGNSIRFRGRFTADSTPPDSSTTPYVFKVTAVIAVDYSLNDVEGIHQQHIDAFAQVNGVFNAYPYWREFVQSAVSRMGLPNVTVPVLILPSLLKLVAEGKQRNVLDPANAPEELGKDDSKV